MVNKFNLRFVLAGRMNGCALRTVQSSSFRNRFEQNQSVVRRSTTLCPTDSRPPQARIFRAALFLPDSRLEARPGHAVPTRRVLSARRVELTDTVEDGAVVRPAKPTTRPVRPYFSSGPCAKPPGWSADKLATEALGRSHRSKLGKTRLQYCIDLMRELLELPDTHRIG